MYAATGQTKPCWHSVFQTVLHKYVTWMKHVVCWDRFYENVFFVKFLFIFSHYLKLIFFSWWQFFKGVIKVTSMGIYLRGFSLLSCTSKCIPFYIKKKHNLNNKLGQLENNVTACMSKVKFGLFFTYGHKLQRK